MIVTTAQLFKHAYGKYAVGAYNINNAEQAMGLFKGAIQSKAPFIIQISKGARKYTDKRMLEAIIRSASEIFPEAIFAVHLDHGDDGGLPLFSRGDVQWDGHHVLGNESRCGGIQLVNQQVACGDSEAVGD